MRREDFVYAADEVHDDLWLKIREALMTEWDPIGVNGIPEAADEYDSYIPAVRKLLIRGASVDELAARLDDVAVTMMGFDSHPELCRAAAIALADLSG